MQVKKFKDGNSGMPEYNRVQYLDTIPFVVYAVETDICYYIGCAKRR